MRKLFFNKAFLVLLALIILIVIVIVGSRNEAFFKKDNFQIKELKGSERPFTWDKIAPLENDFPTDEGGIILYENKYYNPIQIANEGLFFIDTYRQTNNPEFLWRAEKYAHKLLELSVKASGALYFPYEFDFALHNIQSETLKAPWYSGMAQGEALSLLTRLYQITEKSEYLESADQVFKSFTNFRGNGPWTVDIDENGYYWIEEYPNPNAASDHVLNGFIYGLYGVYDYYSLTGNIQSRAILNASLLTLKHYLPDFRNPGQISFYCLGHKQMSESYHRKHIKQLEMLYKITNDIFFKTMADKFYEDYH